MPSLLPEVSLVLKARKHYKRLAEDTSTLSEVPINGHSWYFPKIQATNGQIKAGCTSFSITASLLTHTHAHVPWFSYPWFISGFPCKQTNPQLILMLQRKVSGMICVMIQETIHPYNWEFVQRLGAGGESLT